MSRRDLGSVLAESRDTIAANASGETFGDDDLDTQEWKARVRAASKSAHSVRPPALDEQAAPVTSIPSAVPQEPRAADVPAEASAAPTRRRSGGLTHQVVTMRARTRTTNQSKVDVVLRPADWRRFTAYEDAILERFGTKVIRATFIHEALERLPDRYQRLERYLPAEPDFAAEPGRVVDTRVASDLKVALMRLHARLRKEHPGLTQGQVAGAAVMLLLEALERELLIAE